MNTKEQIPSESNRGGTHDQVLRFYLKTYGCQMNVSDSDFIASTLTKAGLSPTQDIKEAGVIVLNTCSVRQLPEQKAYSFLGRAEPLKKKNRSLKIIVAGCMAERAGKEIKKRFKIVDLVVGAKDIANFPDILKNEFTKWGISVPAPELVKMPETANSGQVSAFVTIMRGCENFCSYCVVPLVRGSELSRPVSDIATEITSLADKGVKEITLLGQNVNSYEDDSRSVVQSSEFLRNLIDFPELLRRISAIRKIERIRFMTSHPKDLSEGLIAAMAELPKVCEHLHLPLQSGSDKVLEKMNRCYTSSDYLKMIEKLRTRIPGINITSDILIGFPGETEDDLNKTLEAIRTAGFDSLFAFKYSARPGTEAAKLKDDVPLVEKEARLQRVLELANGISCEKNAKLINSVQEILVDSGANGVYEGRTRTNKKVTFGSETDMTARIALVKIIDVKINSLSGKLEQVLR